MIASMQLPNIQLFRQLQKHATTTATQQPNDTVNKFAIVEDHHSYDYRRLLSDIHTVKEKITPKSVLLFFVYLSHYLNVINVYISIHL
jgi:hypothetical protein